MKKTISPLLMMCGMLAFAENLMPNPGGEQVISEARFRDMTRYKVHRMPLEAEIPAGWGVMCFPQKNCQVKNPYPLKFGSSTSEKHSGQRSVYAEVQNMGIPSVALAGYIVLGQSDGYLCDPKMKVA